MFASEDFIQATRQFVCIRIETYENKESEEMVRELLNGRFANTSFCIFDPSGTQRLSQAGRGPSSVGSRRGGGEQSEESIIRELNRIASRYRPREEGSVTLQDFNTFRQALNVASADQRLLLFVVGDEEEIVNAQANLSKAFKDNEVVGKFHLDLYDPDCDDGWVNKIKNSRVQSGLYVIHSGQFGMDGRVVAQLPMSASSEKIKSTLLKANREFGELEDRKTYGDHVNQGRRRGIYFENEIPYGEDRDGDGKIDNQRGQRQRGRGR